MHRSELEEEKSTITSAITLLCEKIKTLSSLQGSPFEEVTLSLIKCVNTLLWFACSEDWYDHTVLDHVAHTYNTLTHSVYAGVYQCMLCLCARANIYVFT